MAELLDLARDVLADRGGLVEPAGEAALEALLPETLAARLGLPEHVRLGEAAAAASDAGALRLAYGSELLERLVGVATEAAPLALATLDEPLRSLSDPQAAALARFTGLNCVLRPSDAPVEEVWAGYLVVDYRYVADADERREGLLRAALSEDGAPVPALCAIDAHPALVGRAEELALGASAEVLLERAGLRARALLDEALAPLGASIRRRHLRDRARVRAYLDGLRAEMEAQLGRLGRRGASEEELAARRAKIDGLDAELERKLADLAARYVLRVELRPVAALHVAIRARRVQLRARRRQAERLLAVQHQAATRAFDPLVCAACGAAVHAFALCDEHLHVLCERCETGRPSAKRCPVGAPAASAPARA
jgi:hypothetical protein